MSSLFSPLAWRGLPLVLVLGLGAGCSAMPSSLGGTSAANVSASKLSRLALGMDRETVLRTMGEPVTAAAKGDTEVFTYVLSEPASRGHKEDFSMRYQVRLVNGKVEAYGRPEDLKGFDK